MFNLFLKGGPVMWPLLITSLTAFSVVIERLLFLWRTKMSRRPDIVKSILIKVQHGHIEAAVKEGQGCHDYSQVHHYNLFSQVLQEIAKKIDKQANTPVLPHGQAVCRTHEHEQHKGEYENACPHLGRNFLEA